MQKINLKNELTKAEKLSENYQEKLEKAKKRQL